MAQDKLDWCRVQGLGFRLKKNTHNNNEYILRSTIAEAGSEVKNGVGTARTSSTAWLTKVQSL